jgi:hypothetical protein
MPLRARPVLAKPLKGLLLSNHDRPPGGEAAGSHASCRPRSLRSVLAAMTKEEESELRTQLARLQQEHRDLDAAIEALVGSPGSDLLQVQRLKKRKLVLRDRIAFIEDQLTPDIIA